MLNARTKLIAGIGIIFFVVSFAVGTFFFYEVGLRKVEIDSLLQEQAQTVAYKKSLESITAALASTESERTFLATRVLKEEEVVDLLTLIETIANEQGIVPKTNSLAVEPVANKNSKNFETLIVNVSLEGSYEALLAALTIYENLPYQSALRNVRFEKNESEAGVQWKSTYEILVTKYKKI